MSQTTAYTPRLKALYDGSVRAELKESLKLSNINQVPKMVKISVNVGLGKNKDNKQAREVAINTLTKITGQKPIETMAKKSIASFKIRAGQNKIGLKVTVRGDRAYEFLDRLINVVVPRLRDFHGVSNKSFDKSGNFSIGFKEQSIFPELEFEDLGFLHGLQVNVVIKSQGREHSKALLQALGMPFEKENK